MARLTGIAVLLALALCSTASARQLLFNVGAYGNTAGATQYTSLAAANAANAASSSDTLPAIALPTLSQIRAFFDSLPHPPGATNIFDPVAPAPAPGPSYAAAPAPGMAAGAAEGGAAAPNMMSGTQT